MGNCCHQNSNAQFSSVNLNELWQRNSLINKQLEQLQTQSNLQIRMMTWNKDSYDLFDYENANRIVQQVKIDNSTYFFRDEASGKIQAARNSPNRILLTVESQQNCFWVQPKVVIYLNQQDKKDYSVWLVIRSIQQKVQSQGVRVKLGDVIRVGKVEMKLKEFHFDDVNTKQMDENNRETILSQSMDDDRCRICLLSSSSIEDPKIAPCSCAGTMALIHLKCLQHWIITKYNLVEENNNVIVFLWDQMKCELCNTNFKRLIEYEGRTIDLVDFSKRQFKNYAVVEMKKTMIKEAERFTYILNLEKLDQFRVGRANDNHVRLCDISVSRFHCKLVLCNQEFYILDNNSKFGTLLKLRKAVPIFKELNCIQFQSGRTVFEFETEKINSGYPKLF